MATGFLVRRVAPSGEMEEGEGQPSSLCEEVQPRSDSKC